MSRQEVYDKCTEKIYPTPEAYEQGVCSVKQLLPQEAIDAIIDCAMEEAVMRMQEEEEKCVTQRIR